MTKISRPPVSLPRAPDRYDQREENEFRRLVSLYLSEPVEDLVRPILDVQATVSSTTYQLYWSGSPNVKVSIDGAAYATPGDSPIEVTRNASGGAPIIYNFRAGPTAQGEYVSQSVTVMPQDDSPSGDARFTNGYCSGGTAPGDGGGEAEITFAYENFPVGWSVDIEIANATGDPITASSGGDTGFTASPATVTMAFGTRAQFDVTLIARDSLLAELTRYTFHVYAIPL